MSDVTPVAILDNETLDVLFESFHPMAVDVHETSKVMRYAVEDGTVRTDHIVEDPVEISIDFVLTGDLVNDFDVVRQAYMDRRIVAVQTRARIYESMVIEGIPHSETAETVDTIRGALSLTEWREVQPDFGELPPRKVAKKRQSSTQKTNKQAEDTDPEDPKKSTAKKIVETAKSFFGGDK